MTNDTRRIHLNLLVSGFGVHGGSWLHPEAAEIETRDLDHYVRIARTAERGTFDALLLADAPALGTGGGVYLGNPFEPITLLSAIATRTSHIGLIPTASTTFNDPYNLARLVASLDLVSAGRAGWNAVTTSNLQAARNFGLDEHLAHAVRYERADEFIAVVQRLWHSWETDAVVRDTVERRQVRPGSVAEIDFEGELFRVAGPLDVPPSAQGRPVQVQAGGSAAGIRLGARHAELVYANAGSLESSRAFVEEFKSLAATYGRDPAHIAIAPGVVPYLADTEEKARRVKREKFGNQALAIVNTALDKLDASLRSIMPDHGVPDPKMPAGHVAFPEVEELRARTLALGPNAGAGERGTILALLGSVERAEILIRRIDAERRSVNRQSVVARAAALKGSRERPMDTGGMSPVPAE